MIVGLILGAILDHYLEARSVAAITNAIRDAKKEIIGEIRRVGGDGTPYQEPTEVELEQVSGV